MKAVTLPWVEALKSEAYHLKIWLSSTVLSAPEIQTLKAQRQQNESTVDLDTSCFVDESTRLRFELIIELLSTEQEIRQRRTTHTGAVYRKMNSCIPVFPDHIILQPLQMHLPPSDQDRRKSKKFRLVQKTQVPYSPNPPSNSNGHSTFPLLVSLLKLLVSQIHAPHIVSIAVKCQVSWASLPCCTQSLVRAHRIYVVFQHGVVLEEQVVAHKADGGDDVAEGLHFDWSGLGGDAATLEDAARWTAAGDGCHLYGKRGGQTCGSVWWGCLRDLWMQWPM